ncbi:carboxypeptidase-like regulatory domain-containing protein [Puia sp.]|jgi:hypothetical protein|uniref:carboxypeptidase-like regulatory domain-containing protein n=1 Tax=Puia sp. TaxID=2045100 RepID=UPI002F42CBB4
MNNTGNHSRSWSDTDVRKYLKGELSPQEMHQLERAALDDPFLADALEGLADAKLLEADINSLRSQLAARVDEKEQKAPILWFRRTAFRVAAAVILLAGVGLTAYYTLFDHKAMENVDVAVTKTNPRSAVSPAPSATTQPQPATIPATASDALTLTAPATTPPATATAPTRPAKRATNSVKLATMTDTTSYALTIPPPKANLFREQPKTESAVIHIRGTASTVGNSQPMAFYGRVVDANNRPLPDASVFLNNAPRIATRTDASGYFFFRFQLHDTTQQMTVAKIGYKQALVSLNTNALTNNIIQLQEAKPSLDEVVVTGFGAKRKETFAAAPSEDSDTRLDSAWIKAYPVIGRLAYQQYLDTAKQTLKLDPAITGIERVSFQVDQKGQLTEFKIEQSLSPAHDAGLIQLISGGPAWKLLRGRKVRAVVNLRFP